MYTLEEIAKGLEQAGYMPSSEVAFAAGTVINFKRPLIVEGAPGTGKTSLAKAVSEWLGLPLIRMQFYEGLTAEQILYDYDYQKQLLTIQAISSALSEELKGKTADEAIRAVQGMDFYSRDFIIPRPLMKALTQPTRCVLLLDELDKSSEEAEHILLEFLESYEISVPQLGTISCPEGREPLVFITSNCFRELSEPLKRRCGYLYIQPKSEQELKDIILQKVKADPLIAEQVAGAVIKLQNRNDIEQKPSTAEALDWARLMKETGDDLKSTALAVAKTKRDVKTVQKVLS